MVSLRAICSGLDLCGFKPALLDSLYFYLITLFKKIFYTNVKIFIALDQSPNTAEITQKYKISLKINFIIKWNSNFLMTV